MNQHCRLMDKDFRERYSRHLLLDEIGEDGQRRLSEAKILLVGVGGLGSPIALYLAAAGVGHLGLMDDDVVSESNLQRQVLYTESEVGLPKVECAKRRLKALNSSIEITAYPFRLDETNAENIISAYDIVIDGTDNFATRYLIGDITSHLSVPYIYGAIREFDGQVSVFNLPDGRKYRDLFPDEDEIMSMPRPSLGVMGVLPGIVGCVEASEAIKLITGCGENLSGKLWTIDLLTMQSFVLDLY